MRGVDSNQLPSYIDEFMWCERYGRCTVDRFDNIVRDIGTQYQVLYVYLFIVTNIMDILKSAVILNSIYYCILEEGVAVA